MTRQCDKCQLKVDDYLLSAVTRNGVTEILCGPCRIQAVAEANGGGIGVIQYPGYLQASIMNEQRAFLLDVLEADPSGPLGELQKKFLGAINQVLCAEAFYPVAISQRVQGSGA